MPRRSGANSITRTFLAPCLVLVASCASDDPTTPDVDPTPVDQAPPIVFAWDESVFTSHADTTVEPTEIVADPNLRIDFASWSPGGEYVSFLGRDDSMDWKLYVMKPDGSERALVTATVNQAGHGVSWSPDGERIAFFGAGGRVYVVNRDGTGESQLTVGEQLGENPHWSPAGDWIVFEGENSVDTGIFRIRPDGTGLELLAPVVQGPYDSKPRYSPTGEQVAFASGQDLYLMNADGSGLEPLTFTPGNGDWFPRWSPDGQRIAFNVDGGTHFQVGIMDLDTRLITDTIGHPSFDSRFPSWSPDGSRIVFQVNLGTAVTEDGPSRQWYGLGTGLYPDWRR